MALELRRVNAFWESERVPVFAGGSTRRFEDFSVWPLRSSGGWLRVTARWALETTNSYARRIGTHARSAKLLRRVRRFRFVIRGIGMPGCLRDDCFDYVYARSSTLQRQAGCRILTNWPRRSSPLFVIDLSDIAPIIYTLRWPRLLTQSPDTQDGALSILRAFVLGVRQLASQSHLATYK